MTIFNLFALLGGLGLFIYGKMCIRDRGTSGNDARGKGKGL